MKKIILTQIIIVICLAFALPSLAQEDSQANQIKAGQAKAVTCIGCHGLNGIAIAPNFPNLAGQKRLYLIQAMRAYRDGIRNDPIMKAMTGALTNTDIENLATYFSSLPRKQ